MNGNQKGKATSPAAYRPLTKEEKADAAAMTALKQVMASHLQKQLAELEEMRNFFKQDLMTGEFDFDKYKENKKEEEKKSAENKSN